MPDTHLVAGGGTGDSTIHLAEQLRESDSVIIHLDLSESSIEIARQRAAVRNMNNITWMQGSLLDLRDADLESFDYINCSEVLHHLHNPA
jgi:ubiquinone/menaquinone biosynthesis C-methylase UbiE